MLLVPDLTTWDLLGVDSRMCQRLLEVMSVRGQAMGVFDAGGIDSEMPSARPRQPLTADNVLPAKLGPFQYASTVTMIDMHIMRHATFADCHPYGRAWRMPGHMLPLQESRRPQSTQWDVQIDCYPEKLLWLQRYDTSLRLPLHALRLTIG